MRAGTRRHEVKGFAPPLASLIPSSVRVVGENAGYSGSGGGYPTVGSRDGAGGVADANVPPEDQGEPADGPDAGGDGGATCRHLWPPRQDHGDSCASLCASV